MPKPSPTSYPVYFQQYIDQVADDDLGTGFENQFSVIVDFLSSITEEGADFAYAEGKWSLKEMLQHIIDTERIFCYRALCIARQEKASLPGFDENEYAAQANANKRTWKSLSDEFLAVRQGTTFLFSSFLPEALSASGTSNNNPISVTAIGFITLGHFTHHLKIVEERYR